eukprot:12398062-Alexandrium_andersonii.AAC.1
MALRRRRGVREQGGLEGAAKSLQRRVRGSTAIAQSVLASRREGAPLRRERLRRGDLRWARRRRGLRSPARPAGEQDRGRGAVRLRGRDAFRR